MQDEMNTTSHKRPTKLFGRSRVECYECGRFLKCGVHETEDGEMVDICTECFLSVNYLKDDPLQADMDLDFSE